MSVQPSKPCQRVRCRRVSKASGLSKLCVKEETSGDAENGTKGGAPSHVFSTRLKPHKGSSRAKRPPNEQPDDWRRKRNRRSAALSRKRKREYVATLEGRIDALEAKVQGLTTANMELTRCNRQLRRRLMKGDARRPSKPILPPLGAALEAAGGNGSPSCPGDGGEDFPLDKVVAQLGSTQSCGIEEVDLGNSVLNGCTPSAGQHDSKVGNSCAMPPPPAPRNGTVWATTNLNLRLNLEPACLRHIAAEATAAAPPANVGVDDTSPTTSPTALGGGPLGLPPQSLMHMDLAEASEVLRMAWNPLESPSPRGAAPGFLLFHSAPPTTVNDVDDTVESPEL